MLTMLERQQLLIIKTIHECGTVTEAASALCLTQSALSHAMKKLEREQQIAIWQKDGRNVRLTPSGQLLLKFANRILPQFEHTEFQLQQIVKGEKGTLRIGMECHPCYQWLLKVITPFIHQYPDVDIDVKQQFQFGALGALLEYDIDMIITPDPLFHNDIDYQAVFDYEHVLAVSSHSPLAANLSVTPTDLMHETLFTYPVEKTRLDIFSRFLTPANASVKRHKVVETTEIMLQMVSVGRGVAALPRWLVDEYQHEFTLRSLQLGESPMMKSIYLGTRNTSETPEFIKKFKVLAKNTC